VTDHERASYVLAAATTVCNGSREDVYRVLMYACARFALESTGQAEVLRLMIEALEAGMRGFENADGARKPELLS
jgi:hypothetical protein